MVAPDIVCGLCLVYQAQTLVPLRTATRRLSSPPSGFNLLHSSQRTSSSTTKKMSFPVRMTAGLFRQATRNLASIESAPSQRIQPLFRNIPPSQCRAYTQAQRPRCMQSAQSALPMQTNFSTTAFRARAKTMGQLKQRNSTGPFSWKAALLFVITGAGLMIYFRVEKARLERKRIAEMSKGVGKPKVGGPFVLTDLDGKEFTAEDLKGKYSFVSGLRCG